MDEDIFRHTKYMRDLYVFGNPIRTFPLKWFPDMRVLKTLNIQATQITSLPESGVNYIGPQNLQYLYLSTNKLVKLTNLSSFIFTNRSILRELIVQRCSLTEIEPNTFGSMINLTILKLDGNPLNASILSKGFIGLKDRPLASLYLTGLQLQNLKSDTFAHRNCL